ncbi:hypothetical protein NEOLEDRAFT_1179636 [Neolentinus lepideus HHB14362 ss-1]|uniref:Uncharacterized protein n=1 Tax=Neolentinus lepideus HHB14362 ss-1 TaxID=1314782 RepID=A0A165RQM9_9AGAM|nr:hypothetical protein NEOLEDRAFT_1179636 [Neolentinus lepideus HHB14362 ss-1]
MGPQGETLLPVANAVPVPKPPTQVSQPFNAPYHPFAKVKPAEEYWTYDLPVNEDEEGEFEDWIDKVHGFVHFVNPVPYIVEHPSVAVYMDEVTEESGRLVEEEQDDDYLKVPRMDKAKKNYECLVLLPEWFEKLERPKEIPDDKYEGFVRYTTRFFPYWWKTVAQE